MKVNDQPQPPNRMGVTYFSLDIIITVLEGAGEN